MAAGLFTPFLLGFILGSIPFGLILTRLSGMGDIRQIGSGNIGATNVLRTGNKGLAALTLFLDMAKGAVAVLIAGPIAQAIASGLNVPFATDFVDGASALREGGFSLVQAQLMAGFGAFLGHLYPPWLGFRGGKGVATYIGVLAGLFWPAAAVFCATWLATAFAARMSSLAAIVASLVAPLTTWWLGRIELMLPLFVLTALLIFRHRANIQRLLAGEEPRIGEKA